MKVTIRGLGHLSNNLGSLVTNIEEDCLNVAELIRRLMNVFPQLREYLEITDSYIDVKPGFLVFVNRIDIRVLLMNESEICNEAFIDIIPVIHHG